MMNISVGLIAIILVGVVLVYALYCKGDVKAGLRVLGIEFSLEAKAAVPVPAPTTPAQIGSGRTKTLPPVPSQRE